MKILVETDKQTYLGLRLLDLRALEKKHELKKTLL